MANFDPIAPFYDALGKLVFGQRLKQAPICYLQQLPPASNILIVGGGTGGIVPDIRNRFPQAHITFIEPSLKMIRRAQDRQVADVDWINQSLEEFRSDRVFDLIFTPFVLDVFHNQELNDAMIKLESLLAADGHWIHSDFYQRDSNWWQGIMLKIMYMFFRWSASLSTSQLPDFDAHFESLDSLEQVKTASWLHGFIKTGWWRKAKRTAPVALGEN